MYARIAGIPPTAAQLACETQDTSVNSGSERPEGTAVCCAVKAVPFQRARSSPAAPLPVTDCPAATQKVSEKQCAVVSALSRAGEPGTPRLLLHERGAGRR